MTNVRKQAFDQVFSEIVSLYAAKKAYSDTIKQIHDADIGKVKYSEEDVEFANSIVNIYGEVIGLLKLTDTSDDAEMKNAKDVVISELSEHVEKYDRLSKSGNSFYNTIKTIYMGLLATV